MSLNDISLPPRLIAELYPDVLVQGTASAMPVKAAIPFLGKNGKNILIVVDQPGVPYLPDQELGFLTNVLSACQLSLLDVAIVNRNKVADPAQLFEQLSPREIVFFDVDPQAFGLPGIPSFRVNSAGDLMYSCAPALHQIENDKEAKKQLWMALKQLFRI